MTNELNYHGMTVNERLFRSGLIDDFDAARERLDKERLVEILREVDVDEQSINDILRSFKIE